MSGRRHVTVVGCLKKAMVAAPLVVALVAGSAVGAQASDTGWAIANSPNVTVAGGSIESVSCSAAAACTAVGSDLNTSGITVTLAERWNGTDWQRETTPNPAGDTTPTVAPTLTGVSCPTASFCVAVGSYSTGPISTGLAESWNGQEWSLQSFPVPVDADGWQLFGVSCTSARFCEAAGGYFDNDTGTNDSFAANWNGTAWTLQSTVNPDPSDFDFEQFNTVSCTSPTFCVAWASGNAGNSGEAMAEQWNGAAWVLQTVPPAAANVTVNSVSCTSANFCEAVAAGSAYGWNGSAWTAQTLPASAASGALQGVSCTSRSFCEAVGEYYANSDVVPVVARWNGSAWKSPAIPNPTNSTFARAFAVSCASANACEAGGYYEVESNANKQKAFTEGWNGSAWGLQQAVAPSGATANGLGGISCVSATFCEAVGAYTDLAGNEENLAETWNGQKWTIQSTPDPTNPDGADYNGLEQVSCVSTQFCEAVGAGGATELSLMWNGTSWTTQTLPGIGAVEPQEVSCANADFCMMTDGFAQVDTWDGTSWSVAPTPTGVTYIGSVSCLSATFCEVVGGGDEDSLAATWNGASLTTQTLAGSVSTAMNSVTCTTTTSCEAVGETPGTNDDEGTAAESWNGSAWTLQTIPTPSTTLGSSLTGVSCTSATSCTAVGSYRSSAVGATYYQSQTLAETWDGTAWTLETSPTPSAGGGLGIVSCVSSQACTAAGNQDDEGGVSATLIETGD